MQEFELENPIKKMNNLISTSDLDAAGSIYPLRVPYEGLEAAGCIFVDFWQVPISTSDLDSAGSIYPYGFDMKPSRLYDGSLSIFDKYLFRPQICTQRGRFTPYGFDMIDFWHETSI